MAIYSVPPFSKKNTEAAGAWAEPGEMDPPSEHPLLRRESGEQRKLPTVWGGWGWGDVKRVRLVTPGNLNGRNLQGNPPVQLDRLDVLKHAGGNNGINHDEPAKPQLVSGSSEASTVCSKNSGFPSLSYFGDGIETINLGFMNLPVLRRHLGWWRATTNCHDAFIVFWF